MSDFEANARFKQNPVRVLLDGVWVGIGSSIQGRDGKEWSEATQSQYNKLGEMKRFDLVKKKPRKAKEQSEDQSQAEQ